ncbi:MAG: M1 family aminopeptidase [Chromatiaceae bacterium]
MSPRWLVLTLLLMTGMGLQAQPLISHDIEVHLTPAQGTLAVRDTLSLPGGQDEWTFVLHQGLNPQVLAGDAHLDTLGSRDDREVFRLRPQGSGPITLVYAGPLQGELQTAEEGMGRSRQWTRGIISPDGVVLDGNSGWYPRFTDSLQHFSLQVTLPADWIAVAQGAGPNRVATTEGARVSWREDQPQDDIYLIAAPFVTYTQPTARGEAQVYLRNPEPELAQRYLDATAEYLAFYSDLIGPYPYAKFALVENFWETGYGMPSFTLLGSQVLRLPFILKSSYPHEILHNWWGNSVFIDYETGNWSEGLTAYLADHLFKEREGQGAAYRRDSLQAYADYVGAGEDFPLTAFQGRHGSASQAIGYGKSLMLFHMLRHDLGDAAFRAGLQAFYRENRFRTAGYDQLRIAFEQASGRDLKGFFAPWTQRVGAPDLALTEVTLEPAASGFQLRGRLEQTQPEAPFPLTVPLLVHLKDGSLIQQRIPLDGRATEFLIELPTPPLRLALDPDFDLFRRLAPGENPPSLSRLLGAARGLIVLPTAETEALATGYLQLAESWTKDAPGWEVVKDDALDRLPEDRPIWLLGWRNRFMTALTAQPIGLDRESHRLELSGESLAGDDLSLALVREVAGRPLGLIATLNPAALTGLARKLPHYGKYGYLAFTGSEPINQLKGQWPAGESRLQVWFTAERPALALVVAPALTAGTAEAHPADRDSGTPSAPAFGTTPVATPVSPTAAGE